MSESHELLHVRPLTTMDAYVAEQLQFNATGLHEAFFNHILAYNVTRFLTLAKKLPTPLDSFLDAGCREGKALEYALSLLGYREQLIGVDIVPQFVEVAIAAGMKCQVADLCALPFTDRSFDMVFCSQALEHTYDPLLALRELSRVSRTLLFIGVPIESDITPDRSHYVTASSIFGWMRLFEALDEEWHVVDFWRNLEIAYLNITLIRKSEAP